MAQVGSGQMPPAIGYFSPSAGPQVTTSGTSNIYHDVELFISNFQINGAGDALLTLDRCFLGEAAQWWLTAFDSEEILRIRHAADPRTWIDLLRCRYGSKKYKTTPALHLTSVHYTFRDAVGAKNVKVHIDQAFQKALVRVGSAQLHLTTDIVLATFDPQLRPLIKLKPAEVQSAGKSGQKTSIEPCHVEDDRVFYATVQDVMGHQMTAEDTLARDSPDDQIRNDYLESQRNINDANGADGARTPGAKPSKTPKKKASRKSLVHKSPAEEHPVQKSLESTSLAQIDSATPQSSKPKKRKRKSSMQQDPGPENVEHSEMVIRSPAKKPSKDQAPTPVPASQQIPASNSPTRKTPAHETPAQENPSQEAPVRRASILETSMLSPIVQEASKQSTPSQEAVKQNPPAQDGSVRKRKPKQSTKQPTTTISALGCQIPLFKEGDHERYFCPGPGCGKWMHNLHRLSIHLNDNPTHAGST